MITKHSKNNFSHTQFWFEKFAQTIGENIIMAGDNELPATDEQRLVALEQIKNGETLPSDVVKYANEASSYTKSIQKLNSEIGDNPEEFFQKVNAADQAGLLQGAGTLFRSSAKDTIKSFRKFSKKYDSLSDSGKIQLLKKSKIFSNDSLVKLSNLVDNDSLTKLSQDSTWAGTGSGGFYTALSGVGRGLTTRLLPGRQGRTGAEVIGNYLKSKITSRQLSAIEDVLSKATLPQGVTAKEIAEQIAKIKPGEKVDDAVKAILTSKGVTSNIDDVAKGVTGAIEGGASSFLGGVGKASKVVGLLSWVGKIFRVLPLLLDVAKFFWALWNCLSAMSTLQEEAPKIGIDTYWWPLVTVSPLEQKFNEVKGNLEKLKTLGVVTATCKSFWQNIVDATLSAVSGYLNLLIVTAEGIGTIATGGLGAAIAGVIGGFIVGYALDTIKRFLSSWIGGMMTSSYTALLEKINGTITPPRREVTQAPAETRTAPTTRLPARLPVTTPRPTTTIERTPEQQRLERIQDKEKIKLERIRGRGERRLERIRGRGARQQARQEAKFQRQKAKQEARNRRRAADELNTLVKISHELELQNLIEEKNLVDQIILKVKMAG